MPGNAGHICYYLIKSSMHFFIRKKKKEKFLSIKAMLINCALRMPRSKEEKCLKTQRDEHRHILLYLYF